LDSFGLKLNERLLQIDDYRPDNIRLIFLDNQSDSNLCENLKKLHNKHVQSVKLIETKRLNERSCESQTTLLIRLKNDREEFHYEPGDHIAIYPENQRDQVDFILSRLDNADCFEKQMQLQCLNKIGEWKLSEKFPIECSIREAFAFYLDISSSLTQSTISGLSSQARNQMDQLKLNCLANVFYLSDKCYLSFFI